MTPAEVEAKLREALMEGDHERLSCPARYAECTCGYTAKLERAAEEAADALAAQAVELERMREALEMIAEGSAPPIPHGHYLAHRRAVDVARVALSVKAG